jgi:4-alpha-glucanotransferase
VRDALIEALFASGSDLLTLPVQDVFGWPDRINVPAVVDQRNWTWRLPWPVDRIAGESEAAERQRALRRWAVRHARA